MTPSRGLNAYQEEHSFLPIKLDFPAILRKQKNDFEIYTRGKNSAKFLLGLPFFCQFY